MRTIPSSLDSKFKKLVQAESTKAAPAVDLWISRPVVPLVNDYFLEQQAIGNGSNVTALDIAVAHPRHRRQSTKIYIATVENGVAKVVSSPFRQAMETHVWTDCGFSESAEDVAVAFDAVMKNDTRGRSEFVTDREPWVFWVKDGALYGRDLGSGETVTLAERNCTKCTAIRSAGSALGGFDYGLCLFFLLNGVIYVRQYIDGEWMDSEPVNFISGVTWKDIAASRSWDYRVVLQAMSTDGTVYELFTQYMGVGQRAVEHIEIKNVDADARLTPLVKTNTAETEHIAVSANAEGALLYGWSSMPVSAANAENEDGDWGYVITVLMDYPVTNVEENAAAFVASDDAGFSFVVNRAFVSEDGKTITLVANNFNGATGDITVSYVPGAVQSPAVPMEAWSVKFTPQNLIAPEGSPPQPINVFCGNNDGTVIHVRFSDQIIAGVSESKDDFVVTIPVLTGIKDGFGEANQNRNISAVTGFAGGNIDVNLESGSFDRIVFGKKGLTLAKEGEST